MHNSLGSPRRPVLWTYWPETCAQRECVCKRKRLRDVRSYAICDFHRGPHAVRGLLLASDAGGSGGTARFRAGAGRCRRGKRPGQWTRLSDPAHLAPRNSRAEFRKRQTALRSPLLSPCRRHWHPGGYSHAGHCGVERARSRRLRALCGGTSRSPPASKSRDGRLSSLLLSGYSRSKFPLNTVTDAFIWLAKFCDVCCRTSSFSIQQIHNAVGSATRFLLTFFPKPRQHSAETSMATFKLIEYQDASPEVRAIYDDIMTTRKTDWINNFWKAIAHDPATLKRTWESIKQIMAPGALDPLTKELVYLAVSVTNQCQYCVASHTASARQKGMTDAMFHELQAVIGMANETNKLVTGYQVEIDEQFKRPLPPLA